MMIENFKNFNESHSEKIRRNLNDKELSKVLNSADEKGEKDQEENKANIDKLNKNKQDEERFNKFKEKNLKGKKKELEIAESLIKEDGDGGAGAGGAGAGAAGSGDASGGVAYFNQGNVDGMGDVKNATVSVIPGDPNGSEAGSGDVSVYLPAQTFTKNTGITGNLFHKAGNTKMNKKFFQDAKKVKDKMGLGKTMTFQQFSKN